MLIGQQCGVDRNAGTSSGAVAPRGWSGQGTRLSSLVAVGRNVDGGEPLLLLRKLFELIFLLRVPPQLDESAEEVGTRDQDDEGYRAEEGSQAGLPGHPTAATHE